MFYTPEGLQRSKRLIFGANAAAELFNEEIRRSITDIYSVINIYDDMLVYGAIQIQHDYALARVLQRMEDLGLTLNKAKCKFSHPKAIFKSHIQKPPQGHLLWDEIHQRGNFPNARPGPGSHGSSTTKIGTRSPVILGMPNFSSPHEEECHVSLVTRRGRSIPRH